MYYKEKPKFPDTFLWGASSAAWQVEGGLLRMAEHRQLLI